MVGKNLQVPTDLCFAVKLTELFSYLKKTAHIISLKTNKYTGVPLLLALLCTFGLSPCILQCSHLTTSAACVLFFSASTPCLPLSLSMPCELSVLVHLLLLHLSPWLQSCITLSPSLSTLCEFVFHPFHSSHYFSLISLFVHPPPVLLHAAGPVRGFSCIFMTLAPAVLQSCFICLADDEISLALSPQFVSWAIALSGKTFVKDAHQDICTYQHWGKWWWNSFVYVKTKMYLCFGK